MNRIYAVVWNRAKGIWTVASELVSRIRQTKSVRLEHKRVLAPRLTALLLGMSAFAPIRLVQAQTVLDPSASTVTITSSNDYLIENGTILTSSGSYVHTLIIKGLNPFTLTNHGQILGATGGGGAGALVQTNGTIVNESNGLIWGNTWGVLFDGALSNANLINRGDISAQSSHPVEYSGSSSGTFDNYGTVNSGAAGTVGTSPNGITVSSSGALTVNNYTGASIKSGTGNGTYGNGAELRGGGAYIINNHGRLEGYHSAIIDSVSAGSVLVNNFSDGVLLGNIAPTVSLTSNSTIRNAGSISGNATAVTFSSSNNTLILESTSSITGNVLGGADGTLALGGSLAGSFDLAQIGDTQQYREFDVFDKRETSSWSLTGAGSQNWVVSNGSLILKAGASLTGATQTIKPGGTFQYGDGGAGTSVTGSFVNDGSLVFNRSEDTLQSAAISGTGAVVQRGPGKVTYTGSNTYTGTTTIDAGTSLQIGNGGTTGSIVGAINNSGELIFNRSDPVTYAGDMAGSGSFSHEGAGTLTYTGTATHTGGTTIASGGTLQVGSGGEKGAIAGDVVNNGTLIANRSGSLHFDGVISGTGKLIKRGTGVLQLSGTNTYVGETRFEGGVLAATLAENFGALGNALTFDGGTLRWLNAFFIGRPAELLAGGGTLDSNDLNVEWRSLTTGVGKLTKTGQGTVYLTVNNTYTGGTSILGGNLQLGNGGTTGSVLGNIANDASLTFNRSDAQTFSSVISGTGSVTQAGPGALTFTTNQTYTGGTTISGGSLQLGNGGTTGRVAGNVVNNGQLLVNRSDNVTDVAGLISGSGSFTKLGTGTLTITRNQTYTGATTISAGTLQVGNGGTAGGIRGNIINNATLIHNRSDTVSFISSLSGAGTFLKNGSGTLRMTANSPFTGATQLNAGITLVDGSLDGSVQVNSGATLGGVGSLGGAVTIANGGH
ncbi:MAG TPA: autotransporter-associated beta strand repeat-containing protein, partial [Pseudoxanthomonas sp.]|nr:autotransporter-associated beta strand repeat-containing protein [Pseudoxanthomonas sp.]